MTALDDHTRRRRPRDDDDDDDDDVGCAPSSRARVRLEWIDHPTLCDFCPSIHGLVLVLVHDHDRGVTAAGTHVVPSQLTSAALACEHDHEHDHEYTFERAKSAERVSARRASW